MEAGAQIGSEVQGSVFMAGGASTDGAADPVSRGMPPLWRRLVSGASRPAQGMSPRCIRLVYSRYPRRLLVAIAYPRVNAPGTRSKV
jgi:hypothetical protein